MSAEPDVFLSFNWKDRGQVRSVDKYLCGHGIRTFMAERDLTVAGSKHIYHEAYEALAHSKVFLAIVGIHGIGNSQLLEIERVNQSEKATFNLLLDGLDFIDLPAYLKENQSYIYPASRYSKEPRNLKDFVSVVKRDVLLT